MNHIKKCMNGETTKVLITIFTALGGFEFIKWLANRKVLARKENAYVKDVEATLHGKQIERYESRLANRDMRVDAIYNELREVQARELELIKQINKKDLEIELLKFQKCEVRGCLNRKPPGTY